MNVQTGSKSYKNILPFFHPEIKIASLSGMTGNRDDF
jgi:hypothetical protein